jgi:uncharacterized protein
MNIAITGATGFIGSNLSDFLEQGGNKISKIDRGAMYDIHKLSGYTGNADVVIHLAGAPIFRLWTKNNKQEIRNSRVETGENLYNSLKELNKKPALVMLTSGISIYGPGGPHDEGSREYADGFLTDLILDLENIAVKINDLGIRTVIMRFGVVLGKGGGALKIMQFPFKLGLGAKIGKGNQKVSFIHIEDLCRAVNYLIKDSDYNGIVNFVSLEAATNGEFAEELAKALNRPCFFAVPEFLIKALLGEASVLITRSVDAEPGVLNGIGFKFKFPRMKQALKDLY